jgi:hypothetical protein
MALLPEKSLSTKLRTPDNPTIGIREIPYFENRPNFRTFAA